MLLITTSLLLLALVHVGSAASKVSLATAKRHERGKAIETVGTYSPFTTSLGSKMVVLNEERIKYWMGHGAVPSNRVQFILGKSGILPMDPHSRAFNVMRDQMRQFEEKCKREAALSSAETPKDKKSHTEDQSTTPLTS